MHTGVPTYPSVDVDVLIVGAGPSGTAMAAGLKQQGLDVLVVEKLAYPVPIFKGEYIQPLAVQILSQSGLKSLFDGPGTSRVDSLRFRDLGPDNKTVLSDVTMSYPGVSSVTMSHFEMKTRCHKILESVLDSGFWAGASAQLLNKECIHSLEKPRVLISHPERGSLVIRARWVIGCDGRNSMVKKWMEIPPTENKGPTVVGSGEEFIVGAEINQSSPTPSCYQVIRTFGQGTFSFFELPGVGQRVYWNTRSKKITPTSNWHSEISVTFSKVDLLSRQGEIGLSPIQGAPANTCVGRKFTSGRFILVGDAAGVTTPFGGQGVTMAAIHVRHLLSSFNFKADSRIEIAKQQDQYFSEVARAYRRTNLLNLGLYHLFFSRSYAMKSATQHVLSTWRMRPELAERTTRLFGGLDETTPNVFEICKLWGISDLGIAPTLALGRSAISLTLSHLGVA